MHDRTDHPLFIVEVQNPAALMSIRSTGCEGHENVQRSADSGRVNLIRGAKFRSDSGLFVLPERKLWMKR